MAKSLKCYKGELLTRGPVFIGDGKSLTKKEYWQKGDVVYIPDFLKMYSELRTLRLDGRFEEYLMDTGSKNLGLWMRTNKISQKSQEKWTDYTLSAKDIHSDSPMEIKTFIKDPYGNPYVPGSSIKGMLRTVLLSYELIKNQEKYLDIRRNIVSEARTSRDKRTSYLQKQEKKIETSVFHTLDRLTERPSDIANAVNDMMSCIHISDSKPLDKKSLTLCQKLDMSVNGNWKPLNVMRECIKPGTKIEFDITVDERFPYSKEDIMAAVKAFVQRYYSRYYIRFTNQNKELAKPKINYVWLGGGAGYVSKTVLYPLFNKDKEARPDGRLPDVEKSIETVAVILQKTVNNKEHDHEGDLARGVSPHMLKCTKCQGKIQEFGQCAFQIK